MKNFLIKLILIYQKIPGSFHNYCKYYPTCSNYAIDAIKKHGVVKGIIMGIFRILRCNPFVEGGVDVVPEKFTIFRNDDK